MDPPSLRVAFASDAPTSAEATAIAGWLTARAGVEAVVIPVGDIAGAPADVTWIHGLEPVPLEALGPGATDLLLRGRVLLTGGAAVLPAAARLDPVAPGEAAREPWTGGEAVLGHATFHGHPLLRDLGDSIATWRPEPGEPHTRVSYLRPRWPERARVLAVERAPQGLNAARATIWEHDGSEGIVLCIGCYLPLHAHPLRLNADRLAAGALARVAAGPPTDADDRTWRLPERGAGEDRSVHVPELPLMEDPLGTPDFRLRAAGDASADRPFTLAGRRLYLVGGEARGVDEVWAHPFRLAEGIRIRDAVAERATVTPVGMERRLRVDGGVVLERLAVPREAPVALFEWRAPSRTVVMELEWTCDLRPDWPYPAESAGPLRWRRAGRGVVVAGPAEDRAVFGFSLAPEELEVADVPGDLSRVRIRAVLRVIGRNSVRLAICGGSGEALVARALRAADRTAAVVQSSRGAAERRMTDQLSLDAPDTAAVQAMEWAKVRLSSYVVEAAGLGRSLVAGYGRPRFVTRDAIWTALASLAVGDSGPARDTLVFLGRHQSPTGAVPDDCATSGWIAHESIDAAPLYLLLAARYLAWTGDVATLQTEWPRILRAYESCLASDHDRDGMIDGGRPVSFRNAGIWVAALRELGMAAESIGDPGSAVEMGNAGDRAAAALAALPETREGDAAGTAARAVPLVLGAVNSRAMEVWLDAVAGGAFTAPWGVRSLPRTHPAYRGGDPERGAVRPALTGLVSWAEYAAGRPDAGFGHWQSNVEEAFRHQRGAWPEALHGDDGGPLGDPDHAAAAALTVLPLVHGILGAAPDATRGRLVLRPAPPQQWPSFSVRGLPLGDAAVDLAYRRSGATHTFTLRQERGGAPARVVMEPALAGTALRQARVDGRPAELDTHRAGERLVVPVQLVLDHARTLELDVEP